MGGWRRTQGCSMLVVLGASRVGSNVYCIWLRCSVEAFLPYGLMSRSSSLALLAVLQMSAFKVGFVWFNWSNLEIRLGDQGNSRSTRYQPAMMNTSQLLLFFY